MLLLFNSFAKDPMVIAPSTWLIVLENSTYGLLITMLSFNIPTFLSASYLLDFSSINFSINLFKKFGLSKTSSNILSVMRY